MATEYYRNLCERFEKLQNAFLPEEFSPTGEYADIVYEHTRAYKVLTHAELEYYFEEAAKAIAQKALREWRSSNQVSNRCWHSLHIIRVLLNRYLNFLTEIMFKWI